MTTTIPTSKSACSVTTRPGNAAVDYGGAQIRAYLHHLATVVTIRGEIDAANVEQISEHVRRFSLGTNPMVLDLSELSHFSGAGISLLCILDEDCRAAGVQWALVASPAVVEQLGGRCDMNPCSRWRARCIKRSTTWLTPSTAAVSWCYR